MTTELQNERSILFERSVINFIGYWDNDFMIAFRKGFFAAFELADKDIEALQSKLDVARKALEEIADGISPIGGIVPPDGIRRKIARQALKEME